MVQTIFTNLTADGRPQTPILLQRGGLRSAVYINWTETARAFMIRAMHGFLQRIAQNASQNAPSLSVRWPLVGLLLLAFWLRLFRLGDKAVWWDEGLAIWSARQSWADIIYWTGRDVHPPLYFWLLNLWRSLSGDTEFGLRFLSVLIGVATVAATYLLGKAMAGRQVGLLAAFFIAVSRFGIIWSQEMRMYALVALLAALALWATVQVWRHGRCHHWALYILFMTAGLYSLYLFALVLLVVNLVWLLLIWPRAAQKWGEFWRWSLAQAAVLLICAPWLAYTIPLIPTWSSATPLSLWDFLQIYWTVLVTGISLNVADYTLYTLPVLAILVAGTAALLWRYWRRPAEQQYLLMLLLGLLLPALIVYLVSLPRSALFYAPPIAPRYLILFLSGYVALLAWGIVEMGRLTKTAWVAPILTLVVLIAAGVGLGDYYPGRILVDDYKSLARAIEAQAQPGDKTLLYTDTGWPVWAYHHPDAWQGVPHPWRITPEQADAYLAPLWAEAEGIWLAATPYAAVSDPQRHMINWLAERATAVTVYEYGDNALHFYARTSERAARVGEMGPRAAPQFAATAVPIPGLQLAGYDQPVRAYRGGDDAHLALYWREIGTAAAVTAALVDRRGAVLTAETFRLTVHSETQNLLRQPVTLRIPPDAPAGRYQFYLIVAGVMTAVPLGEAVIRPPTDRILLADEVNIPTPLQADFGDQIRLLGYELRRDDARPGGTITLTLYWQAQGPVSQRYKVFTHIMGDVYNADNDNFLWGQRDNEPVNAARPTTTWRPGELVIDPYTIPIAPHAPPGAYQIVIGLYDAITGERLPLLDGPGGTAVGDHLVLTTITLD